MIFVQLHGHLVPHIVCYEFSRISELVVINAVDVEVVAEIFQERHETFSIGIFRGRDKKTVRGLLDGLSVRQRQGAVRIFFRIADLRRPLIMNINETFDIGSASAGFRKHIAYESAHRLHGKFRDR